jgi:hypothetical protein
VHGSSGNETAIPDMRFWLRRDGNQPVPAFLLTVACFEADHVPSVSFCFIHCRVCPFENVTF